MYVREMCLCVFVHGCRHLCGGQRTSWRTCTLFPSPSSLLFNSASIRRLDLVSRDSPVYASCLPLGVARVTDNCALLSGF